MTHICFLTYVSITLPIIILQLGLEKELFTDALIHFIMIYNEYYSHLFELSYKNNNYFELLDNFSVETFPVNDTSLTTSPILKKSSQTL